MINCRQQQRMHLWLTYAMLPHLGCCCYCSCLAMQMWRSVAVPTMWACWLACLLLLLLLLLINPRLLPCVGHFWLSAPARQALHFIHFTPAAANTRAANSASSLELELESGLRLALLQLLQLRDAQPQLALGIGISLSAEQWQRLSSPLFDCFTPLPPHLPLAMWPPFVEQLVPLVSGWFCACGWFIFFRIFFSSLLLLFLTFYFFALLPFPSFSLQFPCAFYFLAGCTWRAAAAFKCCLKLC